MKTKMKMKKCFWIWSFLIPVVILSSCKKDDPLNETDPSGKIIGPVACYTFDDGTADDLSIYGFDGVLNNNPEFITDTPNETGYAVFFRAAEKQYLNIPYNPFEELTEYTILFWIKDFRDGLIFSGVGSNKERPKNYPQLICANGKFEFNSTWRDVYDPPAFSYDAPAIQDGQWHFLSITCLNNTDQYQSTIKLYIDGKLTDTMTTGLSIYTGNVTKFQFGGDGDGMRLLYSGYVTATNLKVDNIRIYDRELSAKDVKTIYDVEK